MSVLRLSSESVMYFIATYWDSIDVLDHSIVLH